MAESVVILSPQIGGSGEASFILQQRGEVLRRTNPELYQRLALQSQRELRPYGSNVTIAFEGTQAVTSNVTEAEVRRNPSLALTIIERQRQQLAEYETSQAQAIRGGYEQQISYRSGQ